GISVGSLAVDVGKMLERKRQIVKQLTSGIEALFKSAGVTPFKGHGRLLEGNRVEVEGADGKQVLEAKHVVIATGSAPVELPVAKFDGERIVDSSGALEFGEVPKRLGVIGAGVIGLELGSVWRRLGSEVVLLEALDTFLYMADQQVAAEALKQFKRQGLDVRLGAKVTGTERTKNGVKVRYGQGGSTGGIEVDRLTVRVGRGRCREGRVGANTGGGAAEGVQGPGGRRAARREGHGHRAHEERRQGALRAGRKHRRDRGRQADRLGRPEAVYGGTARRQHRRRARRARFRQGRRELPHDGPQRLGRRRRRARTDARSEEHTSELQSRENLVCR